MTLTVDLAPPESEDHVPRHLALWAAIIVLLLGGVGSAFVVEDGKPKAVGVSTITAAADAAEQMASVTMEGVVTTTIQGKTITMTQVMHIDNANKRGDARFDYGDLPIPDMEMAFGDGAFYFAVPATLRGFSNGRAWLRAPLPESPDASANPAMSGQGFLSYLAGAEGTVETVGTDQIRGTDTTHYRVPIDFARLLEQGRAQQANLGVPAASPPAGGKAQSADVWLDDAGRLRRLALEVSQDAGGVEARAHVRLDLFDFGKPVSVTLPPASDVLDVATMADAFKVLSGHPVGG